MIVPAVDENPRGSRGRLEAVVQSDAPPRGGGGLDAEAEKRPVPPPCRDGDLVYP